MKKLHRQFFWLLILLLPIQLGRHFWPEWTQVLGLPIDYLSPTLYLTDLLVVAVLISWWWEKKKRFKLGRIQKHWWLGAIFLFLLVNVFLAENRGVAFYKLIKIIEFSLFGFYVAKERIVIRDLRLPLSVAVIYSSLIALAQFIKQGSLNGLFWWLGERTFSIATPGIAKAILGGRLVLRPYATFPHPNVLAGFILVALILIGASYQEKGWRRIITWATQILGGAAILFSFSRTTWLVGSFVGLGYLVKNWWKKKIIVTAIFLSSLAIISLFYYRFALPLSGQEAFTHRFFLAQLALEMVKTNPLSGVGLNNFISQLPHYWQQSGTIYWFQPVHNLYLLIAAETGVMGLLVFLWLLVLTFRRLFKTSRWTLITALSAILALGFSDHYWLTLQQTQLLLAVVFGLSWKQ